MWLNQPLMDGFIPAMQLKEVVTEIAQSFPSCSDFKAELEAMGIATHLISKGEQGRSGGWHATDTVAPYPHPPTWAS